MEDKWAKLEEIVRRVVREEIAALKKKPKIDFVNGQWKGISEDHLNAWSAAYPGVDIQAELKRAAAWCISNPAGAPKSEFGRYLNTWLKGEQNKLAIRSIAGGKRDDFGPGKKLCAYCERVATGSTSGVWTCAEHLKDHLAGVPVPHMRGVPAKAVAGE